MNNTRGRYLTVLLALLAVLAITHRNPAAASGSGNQQEYRDRGGAIHTYIDSQGNLVGTLANSLQVPTTIVHFWKTLTTAQLKTMYTTPINLLAGPGAGKWYTLDGPVHVNVNYGTAALTGGGAFVIQYHDSAVAATGTLAAAQFQISSSVSQNVILAVAVVGAAPSTGTTTTDAGALEATNATAVFAGSSSTTTATIHGNYQTN